MEFNGKKGHTPQISISDDVYHIIGSYGDDTESSDSQPPNNNNNNDDVRSRRHGSYFDATTVAKTHHHLSNTRSGRSPPRTPLAPTMNNEKLPLSTDGGSGSGGVPISKSLRRKSRHMDTENDPSGADGQPSPTTSLNHQASPEMAFPLNDIDYESSPAAVAQELSNLQAIRRMSMNVDAADPDLPSFGAAFGSIPTVAPKGSDDDDDPSKLFWVPARLHPELAPKEFKTFIEDRVDKIRRRSGGEDNLSPDGLERSGSNSSLRRKKSMLSHQIDTKGNYEDGAERLERKRSKGMQVEGQATVANLAELETLVNDPAQLMRRMSLDTVRRSQDSGIEVLPDEDDLPILPPVGTLKRSTRTTYRRGSLKKGERVPFSKRARQRQSENEAEDSQAGQGSPTLEEPILGITRVQTEPISLRSDKREHYSWQPQRRETGLGVSEPPQNRVEVPKIQEPTSPPQKQPPEEVYQDDRPLEKQERRQEDPPEERPRPQPRQFQSRIASPGRTTAQLPGYNNTNPLPNIIETLPDGTKVPVPSLIKNLPERKSSHELPRQFQRGAHTRPAPGRQSSSASSAASTLDDISSNPSPLPGSGNTRTDALTLVPTFDDRKSEKKEGSRKSSWKWILGNDGEDKNSKEDKSSDSAKSKTSKLVKAPADKARLDVLQNSIEGTASPRGRESLVLNREDFRLDEERTKQSKKSTDSNRKDKDKEPGLLSALFGGKKKTSDGEGKEKKRKPETSLLHPEAAPRIMKADIDYNWTRFSILEERAIYRMAHIKLANPRRALYSQVLLSNFMYSYLAKVQMMHPQVQIPAAQKAAQQRNQKSSDEQQQQKQPPEYSQYQRWQEVSP